jgi:flagellin-like protein
MKGISPIIATVLLISFAVGVAGIVSIWLTGFTGDTTEMTTERGNKITECTGVSLEVKSVTDSGILYLNPSIKTITNITVYDESGRNLTYNAPDLNAGQVSNVTWYRGSNASIFMAGLCEGLILVRGDCKQGLSCWK